MISRLEEPIIFPTEEQIDTYTHSKNVPLKVGSDLRPLERGVFDLSELNEEISPVRYFWTKNGDTIVVASEEISNANLPPRFQETERSLRGIHFQYSLSRGHLRLSPLYKNGQSKIIRVERGIFGNENTCSGLLYD